MGLEAFLFISFVNNELCKFHLSPFILIFFLSFSSFLLNFECDRKDLHDSNQKNPTFNQRPPPPDHRPQIGTPLQTPPPLLNPPMADPPLPLRHLRPSEPDLPLQHHLFSSAAAAAAPSSLAFDGVRNRVQHRLGRRLLSPHRSVRLRVWTVLRLFASSPRFHLLLRPNRFAQRIELSIYMPKNWRRFNIWSVRNRFSHCILILMVDFCFSFCSVGTSYRAKSCLGVFRLCD